MKPLLFALLLAGVCAQGQTQKPPAQQTTPSRASVPGPYDPNHRIPPVGLNLTPEQTKQLVPLLPNPGTPDSSKMVEGNRQQIEKIAGKDGYKKIHDWERQHERPTPPAK